MQQANYFRGAHYMRYDHGDNDQRQNARVHVVPVQQRYHNAFEKRRALFGRSSRRGALATGTPRQPVGRVHVGGPISGRLPSFQNLHRR
jgi:hypothetical protein